MQFLCRVLVCALLLAGLSASAFAAPSKSAEQAFVQWLQSHNVNVPTVKFVDFVETGPGAMATADIPADSTLVRIPRSAFLSSSRINDTEMFEAIQSVRGFNPQYQLALVLLHEQALGAQSKWAPYIAMLPQELDTTLYFSEDEMEELKGSNVIALTEARRQQLRKNYDEIFPFFFDSFPKVFDKKTFNFDNFEWALSTVWRRSFFVREKNDQTAAVFIPLLDRFNHGPVETHFRLDEDADLLEITVKSAFKKGEQVYVSRGPKSNLELLLDFGYVLEENPNDNVALNVRMTGDDKLAKLKVSLLQLAGLEGNATYLLYDSLISQELLKALRIQLLRDTELEKYERVTSGKSVSLGNELRVLRAILAACNNMLQQYKTTVEEDEQLLKTKLPLRERSAVVLRRNEKKIIGSVMLEVSKRWRDILLEGFAETNQEDDEMEAIRKQADAEQQKAASAKPAPSDRKDEL